MRDGLGIGHAVTLEMGCEDEHVGFGIERGEALRRYGAERDNSVSEFVVRDVGIKLRGGIPVARAVTGNRQPPGRIGKCRQRCNQRVEPLARHHRADAISSLAAFIGIGIALLGGRGWEAADDWAALVAAVLVAVNGIRTLRPAISGLMDEAPDRTVKERALQAATGVSGVRSVENLNVRSSGIGFYVDLHVKADPRLSLEEAHEIAAKVKYGILEAIPNAVNVLVHMEPFEGA